MSYLIVQLIDKSKPVFILRNAIINIGITKFSFRSNYGICHFVASQSPASRANLHEGDIIIEFDGGIITQSVDLTKHLIASRLIKKSTSMRIVRQTKIVDVEIVPVERPAA